MYSKLFIPFSNYLIWSVSFLLLCACSEVSIHSATYGADTLKIKEWNTAALANLYGEPDSTVFWGDAALKLSDSLAYENGRFQSRFTIGLGYRALGKYQQSIDQLVVAEEIAQRMKDTLLQTRVWSVVSQVYSDLGDNENALASGMEGLLLAEQANLISQEAYLQSIVGMAYARREKDHDKALACYDKSLQLYRAIGDSTMLSFVLGNQAHIYLDRGNINLAEENYKAAYQLAQDLNKPKAILTALQSLSHFYGRIDQSEQALQYLLEARHMLEQMPGDRTQYLFMLYQLSELYLKMGELELALKYGHEAMQIAEREKRLWHLNRIASKIAEIYASKLDYKEAYLWSDKARQFQDSLSTQEKQDNIVRIEERYKYQKIQDHAKAEHRLELQRKHSYLHMFALISISLLAGLIAVVWFLRQRNMLNKKLQEANEHIGKQNDRLKEKAHFRTQLISLITHDVRAPIANLDIIIKLLEYRTISGSPEENSLRECRYEVNKVRYFMDDFLRWAVFQSEGVKIHKSFFELQDVVKDILSLYDQQAREKNIALKYHFYKDITVYGVKEAMATVIRNLVGNAIKFTETGGIVEIRAVENMEGRNRAISVSVRDNGIGMSKVAQEGLFVETPQAEDGSRKGLGLFLCNYFLSLHDSQLQVNSRTGIGTEFSFTLSQPLIESEKLLAKAPLQEF